MLASNEGRVRKLWRVFSSNVGDFVALPMGILCSNDFRSVGTSAVGLLTRVNDGRDRNWNLRWKLCNMGRWS